MTATSAHLAEAGARQRGKHPTCGKLGEPSHRSGSDFDLDRHQWLSGRLLSLASQRVDIELQCAPSAINGLAASASVDVATGHFRD